MPIYTYQVVNDDGSAGEIFEVEQSANAFAVECHPVTGKKVVRLYDSPNISTQYTTGKEKSFSDVSRIKKAGFKVLQKDKITGNYHSL